MSLTVLLDDVPHVVGFARLLEFATCYEVFNLANGANCVFVRLSQPAKIWLRERKKWEWEIYWVTRGSSPSRSSMSSLAASVTVLVWLVKTAPRELSRSPRRIRFGVPEKTDIVKDFFSVLKYGTDCDCFMR